MGTQLVADRPADARRLARRRGDSNFVIPAADTRLRIGFVSTVMPRIASEVARSIVEQKFGLNLVFVLCGETIAFVRVKLVESISLEWKRTIEIGRAGSWQVAAGEPEGAGQQRVKNRSLVIDPAKTQFRILCSVETPRGTAEKCAINEVREARPSLEPLFAERKSSHHNSSAADG